MPAGHTGAQIDGSSSCGWYCVVLVLCNEQGFQQAMVSWSHEEPEGQVGVVTLAAKIRFGQLGSNPEQSYNTEFKGQFILKYKLGIVTRVWYILE